MLAQLLEVWSNPGCWWQNFSLPDSSSCNPSLLLRQLFWERFISSGGKPLEQCWQNVISNVTGQEFPTAWGPHLLVLQQPRESFPEEGRESVWEFRVVSPYFTIWGLSESISWFICDIFSACTSLLTRFPINDWALPEAGSEVQGY